MAAFFAWFAALGKFLYMDNLRKQHVIVVEKCCICLRDEKSVDYLLLHCVMTYVICITFFNCFSTCICFELCLDA
jgi:hypothetical protein